MAFTTSCFVRIEDVEKRKELMTWLGNIGYILNCSHDEKYEFVVALNDKKLSLVGICACLDSSIFLGSSRAIDCEGSVEMFKALAAMNDEIDIPEQYLTATASLYVQDGNKARRVAPDGALIKRRDISGMYFNSIHEATVEEVVEHFKNTK